MSFATVLERLARQENPYPGLRPFDEKEAHLFYGREPQIAALADRIAARRFVAVVGTSGCGKSSLVLAGLLPAQKKEREWRDSIMRPRGAPFAELAKSIRIPEPQLRRSSFGLMNAVTGQGPLLLVVDQFEELFRYRDQEFLNTAEKARASADAAEFVQLLLTSTQEPGPVSVILTMRSEYLGRCAEFRGLPEALNGGQYLVPRLSREQRREVIEGPLGRTRIAPSVVEAMLNEIGDEPDRLPVLQHALMRTWQQWRNSDPAGSGEINRDDYDTIGGIEGALDQHGNVLMMGLQSAFVETIFRRLTAVGANQQERRDPATVSELYELCGAVSDVQQAEVRAVLDRFRLGDATFLTPRDGELTPVSWIDITHESLMRNWRVLRDQWMPAEHRAARTLTRLRERAANFQERRSFLAGLDLTDALTWDQKRNKSAAWARTYGAEQDIANVIAYIAASSEESESRERYERERHEAELRNARELREAAEETARAEASLAARTKRYAYVFLGLFLFSMVLAGLAYKATQDADRERETTKGTNISLLHINNALDLMKMRLLHENGWTDDRIRNSNPEQIEQSMLAGEKLLDLTAPSSGRTSAIAKVPIYYYPKASEPVNTLIQNWKLMGYTVVTVPAKNTEAANVLWFRGSVSPEVIRPVALTLIRAGIPFGAVRRLPGAGAPAIDIGYDPAYLDLPPWKVDEVLSQKSFDEPRAGTGKAFIEVHAPNAAEVRATYAFLDAHAATYKVTTKNGNVAMIATQLTGEDQARQLLGQMQAAGLRGILARP